MSLRIFSLHIVILYSDILLYLLFFSAIGLFIAARHSRYWRMIGNYILHSSVAVVCGIILLFYLGIALLDSLHFESQKELSNSSVSSVLDVLLYPLGVTDEKTYSAPFASKLYSKEWITLKNNVRVRDYPALNYTAKNNITSDTQRYQVVMLAILHSSLYALIGMLAIISLIMVTLSWKSQQRLAYLFSNLLFSKTPFPWRAACITLGVILLLWFNALGLAQYFHIMGTDRIGHDVFYETIKSIRTGLLIGLLTTLIIVPFAILFGLVAGYFRGVIDDIVQYIYTTLSSIPDVLLIAAAALVLQTYMLIHPALFPNATVRADIRLLALCAILGITSWTNLCRLLRAETFKICEQDYVTASLALGVSHAKIIWKHVLPNVMHLIIIAFVMDFSSLILAEAILTYVGVGVDPSINSWGNMINAARLELAREPVVWWPLAAAFLLMSILVISANLFADIVRDAFDPRLKDEEL